MLLHVARYLEETCILLMHRSLSGKMKKEKQTMTIAYDKSWISGAKQIQAKLFQLPNDSFLSKKRLLSSKTRQIKPPVRAWKCFRQK